MYHGATAPLIFPTPTMAVRQQFLILDLNGILVQCVHCSRALTVPFSMPENMDYGGLPMYIKKSLSTLSLDFVDFFLQVVQSKWWVTVRSSMKS